MKLNSNYVRRSVAGETVIVPTGEASAKFNAMISLNDTALTIWEELESGKNIEQIIETLMNEYDVEHEQAEKDAYGFCEMLKEQDILQES